VYTLSGDKLAAALEHLSAQPLPNADQVFPWLHGLHADNQIQLGFFGAKRRSYRKVPRCLRGIAIVKSGGDLSSSKLRGAIAPEEILASTSPDCATFLECDPKDGFSVRNFQIQTCKMAMVSDIVVYGDEVTGLEKTIALAKAISKAQRQFEAKNGLPRCSFNTFMLSGKSWTMLLSDSSE
jgi:dual specificity MAP kinase phosphatase